MNKKICPRCKGNGYIKVIKEVKWPSKQEEIVVQCTMCNSEGEIEDVGPKEEKNSIEIERENFRKNSILWDQGFWNLSGEMEMLLKQKAYLQHQCRKAGALIKSLQGHC